MEEKPERKGSESEHMDRKKNTHVKKNTQDNTMPEDVKIAERKGDRGAEEENMETMPNDESTGTCGPIRTMRRTLWTRRSCGGGQWQPEVA